MNPSDLDQAEIGKYDGAKMDGFLRAGSNHVFSIGYYGDQDIPFLASLARSYTTCKGYGHRSRLWDTTT